MARKTLGTKRWKDFRISIMVRDKFLCQESLRYGKKVAAVMVHHIYPVSEYPELEFVSWNCISLSNHEHNKMHNRVNDLITRKGKIWQAKRKKEFEKFYSSKKFFEKNFLSPHLKKFFWSGWETEERELFPTAG